MVSSAISKNIQIAIDRILSKQEPSLRNNVKSFHIFVSQHTERQLRINSLFFGYLTTP